MPFEDYHICSVLPIYCFKFGKNGSGHPTNTPWEEETNTNVSFIFHCVVSARVQ